MIDNLNLIKELLNFENEGDFYMLYVLKRKKDQPEGERDNHQSVRTIKTYCIESIEHLEKRYDEVKQLCEIFKARAYIHVQKQNQKEVSLNMMVELAQRIQNGQHNQKGLFDSVVGQLKTSEKRWIIDVDDSKVPSPMMIAFIEYECRPITVVKFDEVGIPIGHEVGPKVEAVIPTKNGHHLITKRFDVMKFKEKYPNIDIQKKNPTLLYLPDSLDDTQELEHLKDGNYIGGLTMPDKPNEWWNKI
jgi:hypothetical protein